MNKKVSMLGSESMKWQCLKKEALTGLILNEIVEVVVPIAFIGSFTTAYYGPNDNTLGDVGCEIWQFSKVEDLYHFFMPVVEMALLDSGSFVLSGIFLWYFGGINILREYCKIIKKYWGHVVFHGGTILSCVSFFVIQNVVLSF